MIPRLVLENLACSQWLAAVRTIESDHADAISNWLSVQGKTLVVALHVEQQ